MALQFVNAAGGTTSVTLTDLYKVGDLIIAFAFRAGSTINPTIAASQGWNSITNTLDGTSSSVSMAWKWARTLSEATGTWTNATRMACGIWRNPMNTATPVGTVAGTSGTTATVTYTSRTLANSNVIGSSWFAAFAGISVTNAVLETAPSGMVNRFNNATTAEISIHDTNGPATANWPSTNVSVTNAGNWITAVIELKADAQEVQNFQENVRCSSAGIVSIGGQGRVMY